MNHSMPGLPVCHQLPEFTQTHVHCVGDAIQPSHPLSSPSPSALKLSQHQGLFKWVSFWHQVAKVMEFQLQHQSFQWIFSTEFFNKEFMIWATVSSQSYFCWLYRTSPSLAAKNITNLISVLSIWSCPRGESVFSCVVGRCLLWPVHSLGTTLSAFAVLHSILQGQICLLLQVLLNFLLLHSPPKE